MWRVRASSVWYFSRHQTHLNTSSGFACSEAVVEPLAADHWDCQEDTWREEAGGVPGGLGDLGDFLGEMEAGGVKEEVAEWGGRNWLNSDRRPAGIRWLK
jgi:hypothetical protein